MKAKMRREDVFAKPTKAAEMSAKVLTRSSLLAIADALHVLVNEVADGRSDQDTFESIRSLTNVLENLSS
jgi:hypothetical protein